MCQSKLFVLSVLWHNLLSISSITRHKRARFGENVAELLLIPYICINHIENESRYQFCTQGFLGKVPKGSFHVISTQKNPDPLGFLRKLVTIRYLVSDDATPILGSPHQVQCHRLKEYIFRFFAFSLISCEP